MIGIDHSWSIGDGKRRTGVAEVVVSDREAVEEGYK
jgi:hypothetical protein